MSMGKLVSGQGSGWLVDVSESTKVDGSVGRIVGRCVGK